MLSAPQASPHQTARFALALLAVLMLALLATLPAAAATDMRRCTGFEDLTAGATYPNSATLVSNGLPFGVGAVLLLVAVALAATVKTPVDDGAGAAAVH